MRRRAILFERRRCPSKRDAILSLGRGSLFERPRRLS